MLWAQLHHEVTFILTSDVVKVHFHLELAFRPRFASLFSCIMTIFILYISLFLFLFHTHTHTHFSLVLFNLKQRFTAQWRETRLRKDTSKLKSMGLVSWGANGLYKRAVYLLECFRYIAFYNANSHVLC